MAGEWIRDNLNGMVEAFRQWYCIPTQVISVGEKRYICAAIRTAEDEATVKWFFEENWRDTQEYTFGEPKPLDDITKDICATAFKGMTEAFVLTTM